MKQLVTGANYFCRYMHSKIRWFTASRVFLGGKPSASAAEQTVRLQKKCGAENLHSFLFFFLPKVHTTTLLLLQFRIATFSHSNTKSENLPHSKEYTLAVEFI